MLWKMLKVKIDSVILNLGLDLTVWDSPFLPYPLQDLIDGLKWLNETEPESLGARRILFVALREIRENLYVNSQDAKVHNQTELAENLLSYYETLYAVYTAYSFGRNIATNVD